MKQVGHMYIVNVTHFVELTFSRCRNGQNIVAQGDLINMLRARRGLDGGLSWKARTNRIVRATAGIGIAIILVVGPS
jgi:hypothetical protein